jgi:translation elongation factor aEF-1 beta
MFKKTRTLEVEETWQKDKQQAYHWLPAQAVENQSRQEQKPPNSPVPTAAKFKSNATANAANSADHTNVPNAASQDLKRRICMGHVIVTYKIFPEDIVKDFEPLKAEIQTRLPKYAEITGYGEEPVAFGLVALLVQMKFPEDQQGVVDELEAKLGEIKGISQVQTLMVRRSSR